MLNDDENAKTGTSSSYKDDSYLKRKELCTKLYECNFKKKKKKFVSFDENKIKNSISVHQANWNAKIWNHIYGHLEHFRRINRIRIK